MATPADKPPPSLPSKEERDHAAHRLLPALDKVARKLRKLHFAIGFGLLTAVAASLNYGNLPAGLFFLVIFIAFLRSRKGHSDRQLMGVAVPTALRQLGLEQVPAGMAFNRSLPARLFPRDGVPLVDAVFSGDVNTVPVAIGEVEVHVPGGESDTEIFRGLVLRVDLSTPLPDFLILEAPLSRKLKRATSRSWLSGKPAFDLAKLALCPAFPPGVHGLCLWLAASARLDDLPIAAVLKALAYPPPSAQIDGRIYSVTNDETAIFVALRPPQVPLWEGELTVSKGQADLLIRKTAEWLAQPLALARALIEAAESAAPKS